MDWLTREQIDQVIEHLAAADLIDASGEGKTSAQVAAAAFDSAAKRMKLSNGTRATEHLKLADLSYMADALGEAVNIDGPLSEGSSEQPGSVEPGV